MSENRRSFFRKLALGAGAAVTMPGAMAKAMNRPRLTEQKNWHVKLSENHLVPSCDNTYDLEAPKVNRPRNIYL